MKRAELFVPIVMAGAICLAQEVKQLPPAAGVTVPTGAGRGAGRGGFGGPIELGPDDKPAFPDPPAGFNVKRDNIPHGELTAVPYDSKSLGTRRQMRVYTPPGYSANRKYPVLFLLHGIGGNDREWTKSCHADIIIDNLLAEGKIQPMVMVFPNGNSSMTADAVGASPGEGAGGVARRPSRAPLLREPARARAGAGARTGRIRELGTPFENDLLKDIIPYIESHYSVYTGPRSSRAGRSLDGRRPDLEHWPGSPRDVCLGRRILLGSRHEAASVRTRARSGGRQTVEADLARLRQQGRPDPHQPGRSPSTSRRMASRTSGTWTEMLTTPPSGTTICICSASASSSSTDGRR